MEEYGALMGSNKGRRRFLALGTGSVVGLLASCKKSALPPLLGAHRTRYGERSLYEKSARYFGESQTPATGSSRTPLQDLYGIITPSSLHFERHHAGVPQIDPADHKLMIHGLVDSPLIFTMNDIKSLPSSSHIYFIECAGNTASEQTGTPRSSPQKSHGLLSCSEWTGVPLSLLLKEAGLKPEATWILAEGADACRLARSIPLSKANDDVLVAYGQNGEALRPEQGYPLRLVVPGWEGNVNIKWVRRIHVLDQPAMTRDEAAYYTDLMPDGRARQFSFVMEAKSVITRPAGEQILPKPGSYEISGFAWSGRGRIDLVEVTTDGGQNWHQAELQEPRLSKALTRFRFPWVWEGKETIIASRCTDDTGYLQPTREEIVAVRGLKGTDHYNGIKYWKVYEDGKVTNA